MAHTPGPWTTLGRGTIQSPEGYVVAICDTGTMLPTEDNATLIAASPDLRRFAQEIAALDPQDFDAHMGEALIRRARALVVKADGAT